MDKIEVLNIGKIDYKKSNKHAPSKLQADTLFTFTSHLSFILPIIRSKMISPRFCVENVEYLRIKEIKQIAFPMKCFCDINLHRIGDHLNWYGCYGLAFTKKWGMDRGIQPIQYINPKSKLCGDFSKAFSSALSSNTKNESGTQKKLKNFILHEMMYYKPYSGKELNRVTGRKSTKCYTDECEWRFVPDVTVLGYQQAYYNDSILQVDLLKDINDSMMGLPEISLEFDYSDLKYIIIKNMEDLRIVTDEINSMNIGNDDKCQLISKIIVWENSKGDF